MVKAVERDEFLQFVTEHTTQLFAEAYAVAGRQDAAERLLQSALERVALRWRRTADPYAYSVDLLHRHRQRWWRQVPRTREPDAGGSPATGGRAVDVGELALYGARRRTTVRVASATAAVLILAGGGTLVGLAAAGGTGDIGSINEPEPDTIVDLAGMTVVTSYYDQGTYVLNPRTGGYDRWTTEPGVMSPDLQLVADFFGDSVHIRAADGGEIRHTVTVPFLGTRAVRWSPDSSTVAVTPVGLGTEGYDVVLLVDAESGRSTEIEIGFPDDRAGWSHPYTGVFWLDTERLAVPTVDTTTPVQTDDDYPHLAAVGHQRVVSVSVVDLSGTVREELSIDTGPTGAGTTWLPAGLVHDARFLMFRVAGPELLEVAAVDLATGSGPYAALPIPVPAEVAQQPPDGFALFAWPSAWLPDDVVVVEIYSRVVGSDGIPAYRNSRHQALLGSLVGGVATYCGLPPGASAAADLADFLGVDLPVPATATPLSFGPAAALSTAAAGLAF